MPESPKNAEFRLTVNITATAGDVYVLPYGHFLCAHQVAHRGNEQQEKIVLAFATHTVLLEGHRLALLLPKIERFEVAKLFHGLIEIEKGKDVMVTNIEVVSNSEK